MEKQNESSARMNGLQAAWQLFLYLLLLAMLTYVLLFVSW